MARTPSLWLASGALLVSSYWAHAMLCAAAPAASLPAGADRSGGLFAVPDGAAGGLPGVKPKKVLRLGPSRANAADPNATNPNPAGPQAAGAMFNPPAQPIANQPKRLVPRKPEAAIVLQIAEGEDPNVAWNDYFASHPDVSPGAVRETARELMHARQFDQLVALIQGALRQGQPQAWMYEAMGLALQASGHSKDELERALTSGIDLSDSPDELMMVAYYMSRCGLERRSLNIFRQVAVTSPLRPEPFMQGLRLALKLDDSSGVRWSTLGILRQAWTEDKREIWDAGLHAAKALLAQMKADKRDAEAAAYEAEVNSALERDCIVTVSWTGDADVDMYVEEPSGTICSFRTPRTTAGGMMMGDTASRSSKVSKDGYTEGYVCPQAFSGSYRVLLRRVWGKVTAGKVTVDVYSHFGGEKPTHESQQVSLADEDVAVVFDIAGGRRQEPLDQALVNNAVMALANVNQAVLAQQLNSIANGAASGALGMSRLGLFGGFNGPFLRGTVNAAVGYSPLISTLSAGASMFATGVISADRRYVRVTPIPFFSQIGQVTTFNLARGVTGTSAGPGAGGGGVAAGGNAFGGGGGGRGMF